MTEVMMIGQRRSSAQAIRDLAQLGFLREDRLTLDATFGKYGGFWTLWQPREIVCNDLCEPEVEHNYDYRCLPWSNSKFGQVAFDPPFKLKGTGGSHESDGRYGVATPYTHWTEMFFDIHDGIDECVRVLADDGIFVFKCMDQVSGGEIRWTNGFINHAERLGCRHVCVVGVRGYRKQPEGKIQRHPRTDISWIHVFLKGDV